MPISELSPNRGQLHVRAAKLLRLAAASFLAAQLIFFPVPSDAGDKPTSAPSTASRVSARVSTNDPVLKAMQTELSRAITELGTSDQPPYYLSYTVYDQDFIMLTGVYGSLLDDRAIAPRFACVTRPGCPPRLDQTPG